MKIDPLPSIRLLVLALCLLVAVRPAAQAEPLETSARQAIILDYRTGAILLEKNADELMAPSSMSKLMTAYLVFEKLKEGSWKMDDRLPVSETSWKRHFKSGGSLMFLPVGSEAKVSDLIRGVIIQSGNDACSVLAEAHSGTEEAFAEFATRRARDLGMRNTTLRNASGWPDPEHLTTARDLSILARRLITDFPEFFPIYSEREFVFNGIKQGNRNPLLYGVSGADGLKTGHTELAGYGLVGTVKRGERRLIMVINGLKSMKDRAEESQRLIEWAYREFENYALFKVGDVVTDAEVWLGEQATIPLVAAERLEVTMPRRARQGMKVTAVYTGPIAAPIRRGEVVGKLVITAPGIETVELPLAAGADVAKLGVIGRISTALRHILWGPKG
ncbi:D-alanyl-D-alanine carboxypeptidase [Magnetospirillum sp. LM-5]|uniref:D-alanyl-D-alanine carboxypeptidase family protein n=1 Tax=Magnetospirillum sp. LM-5 TaxID=2681466 RepID=UPI001380C3AB|nr:D-alanyl-D-alanine carboxypeptidase family protein [Magnetospirillum sp. LM-5]CAA7613374.1 D-alanyl-D-alanine carboxypeptidase [Magnetospirillum sp. LM-5]